MALLKHLVKVDEAGRIDLIVQKLTARSRTQVRGLFDHDCVSLNGVLCSDAGTRIVANNEVSVSYDKNRNYKEKPRAYHSPIFELVFEDDWLLVINKKAGFLTAPNHPGELDTVMGALSRYLNISSPRRRPVSIVHRLDRDTSGLLVFAKSDAIAQKIKVQFEKRKPQREYLAIVAGKLKNESGSFRNFLMTDENLNQHSTNDESQGKLAITHYTVKQHFADATLISVTLETGRRNQIRVHFAEIGHPVLGDIRYESGLAFHSRWRAKRLALHAALLGFKHPVTGKDLLFRAKTPEEFVKFAT
jgi:23S rRNA pseudouridine1911/1915/1917 synthase